MTYILVYPYLISFNIIIIRNIWNGWPFAKCDIADDNSLSRKTNNSAGGKWLHFMRVSILIRCLVSWEKLWYAGTSLRKNAGFTSEWFHWEKWENEKVSLNIFDILAKILDLIAFIYLCTFRYSTRLDSRATLVRQTWCVK